MEKVVTLTCNPCIDRTIPDDGSAVAVQTGGKGLNAARVLGRLGVICTAVAPVGSGENGQLLEKLAVEEGIRLAGIRTKADTRVIDTYRTMRDDSQRVDYRRGTDAEEAEAEALLAVLREELAGARLLMVCGSAPGPVLAHVAAQAITMAREAGVQSLLDSNGAALQAGYAAGPTMIKPNEKELAELTGHDIAPGEEEEEAARSLLNADTRYAVVSLGARGAVWVEENNAFYCPAPHVHTVNAVGSGDSFTAALCASLLRGEGIGVSLRYACAAGAANAQMFPAARIGAEEIEALLAAQGNGIPSLL